MSHIHDLPPGLLDSPARDLHRILEGPTVLHLRGRRSPALFISVLQHGNEDSGWEAVRRLLADYADRELPRSLILFVANVEAARFGLRRLDHQPDFNRCWPGGPPAATAVHRALSELTDRIRSMNPFFSLDIHNNSGRNPHYAAVNRLAGPWLHLAREFDRRAVYFRHPKGTLSDTFSHFCPAITLECGKAGSSDAVPHCLDYLRRAITWTELADDVALDDGFELYRTVARTTVAPGIDFDFGEADADIAFVPGLEDLNFRLLGEGLVLADIRRGRPGAVHALTYAGEDVTADYFRIDGGGRLVVGKPFVPAMFSTDERVVRQDCLCYVMEPMETPGARRAEAGAEGRSLATSRAMRRSAR